MTARFEKQMTQPREVEVCVEVTCDLCGTAAPRPGDWSGYGRGEWVADPYAVELVSVSHESGSSYPEGSFTTTQSFDVCPQCWDTKLMPWFKSQGAAPTVRKRDD
jgi:hypothetical protein